ncbi:response regulator [Actinoplanes sp. Pm04-4]|uniref:Response regulator n=1 Tax=Paractinoplanes pyxinae TaxID=2997416 RepID=A0ABT4ARF0_9ACTN|nr:response regulator [Actinoplanes pyxinae]MCY1136392.1 response regulator [Actinoplanes pyxinae]
MQASAGPSKPGVLIVDDDADILDLLSRTLELRGFRTWTAANADDALQVCRQQPGDIDVLLAGLSLPDDLSGGLAHRVAAESPQVKTIFVTGVPRYIAVGSGLVRPDAPYVQKPANPDLLAGMICNTLQRASAQGDRG